MAVCAKRGTVPTFSSRVRIVHRGVVGCVDLLVPSLGRGRLGFRTAIGAVLAVTKPSLELFESYDSYL